uniref:Uncharacterized protein n=1 Tax=Trypanosoma congolense (strain IL3000) TaxID=1068625 RepID=G0UKK0_TRYCI|nr:conserved hypothetical protein [Trypanosoma congolense IL3000]
MMSRMRMEHGVGDPGTVKASCSRRPLRHQKPVVEATEQEDNADKKASLEINESAVEEAILTVVMELLQRNSSAPVEVNNCQQITQMANELIEMDDFRYSQQRSTKHKAGPRRRAAPLSVFGGGMQAFASDDAEAAESLYNCVLDALKKYVWSHVNVSPQQSGQCSFPPATANFALALQLDLMSVCLQIIETRLTCTKNTANSSVWIQYDGPRESEPLARNAVHCLPFESLGAKTSLRPIFRLEYWVTRENMWAVVEALMTSVRGGIVEGSDAYNVFNARSDTYVDPNALFPTRVPLFSLLPVDATQSARNDPELGRGKKFFSNTQGDDQVNDKNGLDEPCAEHFHVEPTALRSLAHIVSVVGTDIIEGDMGANQHNAKQRYSDATCAVVEAVRELLEDTGIRGAVQRRAKGKINEIAQRREVDERVSREERERNIVAAAEAEAEMVVQRILQELRVEEARNP